MDYSRYRCTIICLISKEYYKEFTLCLGAKKFRKVRRLIKSKVAAEQNQHFRMFFVLKRVCQYIHRLIDLPSDQWNPCAPKRRIVCYRIVAFLIDRPGRWKTRPGKLSPIVCIITNCRIPLPAPEHRWLQHNGSYIKNSGNQTRSHQMQDWVNEICKRQRR